MKSQSYPLTEAEAVKYFDKVLAYADAKFAEKFNKLAAKGDFFSLAPTRLDKATVVQFDSPVMPKAPQVPSGDGKYLVSEIKNLNADLAQLVLRRAQNLQHPTIYLHEPYLTKDEPNDELSKNLTAVENRLFFVQPLKSVSAEELQDKIHNYSVTWHSLLILVDQKNIEKSLNSLLSDAALIAVGAYKGESHLYWTI
jgi:hypothetical protein